MTIVNQTNTGTVPKAGKLEEPLNNGEETHRTDFTERAGRYHLELY